MKAATLSELKQELVSRTPKELIDISMRLAKHKKENKELLTYLLFEAGDEENFINAIKSETEQEFSAMNSSNLYYAKKTIRKILRTLNKYIRFSGSKKTEAELRIHFVRTLESSGIAFRKSQVLFNLYSGQLKKIDAAIDTLHEDLQFDLRQEIKKSIVSSQ